MMTREPELYSSTIKTPIGHAVLKASDLGVVSLVLTDLPKDKTPLNDSSLIISQATEELKEYFEGKRQHFSVPIAPEGTTFQKRVWAQLQKIPFGKTWSYLEMAQHLGDPKCVRAAAAANGKNPLWILVPCHRVIGSNGSLTGYAGELWRKKWLLEHEYPSIQLNLFDPNQHR